MYAERIRDRWHELEAVRDRVEEEALVQGSGTSSAALLLAAARVADERENATSEADKEAGEPTSEPAQLSWDVCPKVPRLSWCLLPATGISRPFRYWESKPRASTCFLKSVGINYPGEN